MKGKKPLPSRRPMSYADVLKLKAEAKSQGVIEAFVIFFSALRDKEGFDRERLRRVLNEMNGYADSIRNGYVTIQDLHAALKEEAGIELFYYQNTPGGLERKDP